MDKEVYIHIGMPKSASTYLQCEIFNRLKGIYFTTMFREYTERCQIADFMDRMRYANPLTFDVKFYKKKLNYYIRTLKEDKVLISWEGLGGDPFGNYMNSLFIANTLKSIFPEAKVLIVTRKQENILESLYLQTLHEYHCSTPDRFLNYRKGEFGFFKPAWWIGVNVDVREFNIYAIAKKYMDLFGKKNILIIPYEILKEDDRFFLKEIYDFLGVDPYFPVVKKVVNRSYSRLTACMAYFLNRFVDTGFHAFGFIPRYSSLLGPPRNYIKIFDRILPYKKKHFINKAKKDTIKSFYSYSNRLLDQITKYDLKKFSYY